MDKMYKVFEINQKEEREYEKKHDEMIKSKGMTKEEYARHVDQLIQKDHADFMERIRVAKLDNEYYERCCHR